MPSAKFNLYTCLYNSNASLQKMYFKPIGQARYNTLHHYFGCDLELSITCHFNNYLNILPAIRSKNYDCSTNPTVFCIGHIRVTFSITGHTDL